MLIAHQPSDQPVITRFKAGVQPVAVGSPKFGKKKQEKYAFEMSPPLEKIEGFKLALGKTN